jgi:glutamine synthetase
MATTARACTCHQSIWKDGKPLFAGNKYADLSEECLYYIGGIIKHAKALNAFTNPSTNSYKRLVPGFEAPVLLAYSARNRSASCRIPWTTSPKAKRVEVRFPDPTGQPLPRLRGDADGRPRRHQEQDRSRAIPMDKDLYDLPPEELKPKIPTVCGSLREALRASTRTASSCSRGGVFTDDQIDAYIELKMEEVIRFEHTPHPVEFDMYYTIWNRAPSARNDTASAITSAFSGASRSRNAPISSRGAPIMTSAARAMNEIPSPNPDQPARPIPA